MAQGLTGALAVARRSAGSRTDECKMRGAVSAAEGPVSPRAFTRRLWRCAAGWRYPGSQRLGL